MANEAWTERRTRTPEARRRYEEERLILWTTEAVCEAMEDQGLDRADRRAPVRRPLAGGCPRTQGGRGHPGAGLQHPRRTGRGLKVTVVDASVMVAALVDSGPEGRWAEAVVGENELAAPELLLVEATNILSRLERRRAISRIEANGAVRDLLRRDIELLPFAPFAVRVWELRHEMSGYFAWNVAVAEAFGLPLATLDRRLCAAPGVRCRFVVGAAR